MGTSPLKAILDVSVTEGSFHYKFGGICSLNDKIYLAPYRAEMMVEYDTRSGTKKRLGVSVAGGSNEYKFAGICSLNDKIYLAPSCAQKMVEYDTRSGSMKAIDVSVAGGSSADGKFGGICSLNDRIYLAPYNAEKMVVYDTRSGTMYALDVSVAGGRSDCKFCGICSLNDKIYLAPSCAQKMVEYDTRSGSMNGVDVSVAGGSSDYKFAGLCSLNDKIYLAPCRAEKMVEYDTRSGAKNAIDVSVARGSIDSKFWGICSLNDKIYLAPSCAKKMVEYDTRSGAKNAIDVSVARGSRNCKFAGICSLNDKIYLAPSEAENMVEYKTGERWPIAPGQLFARRVQMAASAHGKDPFQQVLYLEEEIQRMKELRDKELAAASIGEYLQANDLKKQREAKEGPLQMQLKDEIEKCREISELRGVSVCYLVDNFQHDARHFTGKENPIFDEICPHLAMGPTGVGFDTICPRDRRPHSSIVDAVAKNQRKRASHFVSWCWKYPLVAVISALMRFAREAGLEHADIFVWICFFCNNQYRIIGEGKPPIEPTRLRQIFGNHLTSIGHVLILLDTFEDPMYTKRIWCVFEAYLCTHQEIPMSIILPESAKSTFTAINPAKMKKHLEEIDIRQASATYEVDERLIKEEIETTVGYDVVNKAVADRLGQWFSDSLSRYFRSSS